MRVRGLAAAVLGSCLLLAGCSGEPSLLASGDVPTHQDQRDGTTSVMTGWTWCTPLAEALGRHGTGTAGTQYLLDDGSYVGALLVQPRDRWDVDGGLLEDLRRQAGSCSERSGTSTTSGELQIEEADGDAGDAGVGWRTVEGDLRSGVVAVEELPDGRVLALGMQWPEGQEAPMTMDDLRTAALAGVERFPAPAS